MKKYRNDYDIITFIDDDLKRVSFINNYKQVTANHSAPEIVEGIANYIDFSKKDKIVLGGINAATMPIVCRNGRLIDFDIFHNQQIARSVNDL